MSDTPRDPSQSSIDQQKQDPNTLHGQQGPGVEYHQARFEGETAEAMQGQARTGSYEADNTGGRTTGQPGAAKSGSAADQSTSLPDPEAQQGQGGQ